MNYYSTRDPAKTPVGLDLALNAGLAPDGGLYVPATLPQLHLNDFDVGSALSDTAALALAPFFAGSSLAPELRAICAESLNLPMPQVPIAGSQSAVLELFHGPTAAFKDFAARFLAACLTRLNAASAAESTVLVATSGDTGGAVAGAFYGRPGFRVVIVYPKGRVSARQAHQLGAFGGNVHAYTVEGNFDDCQALVKRAFSNQALRAKVQLISANSISLGRLLPQMAYYVHASLRWHAQRGTPVNLIIPTGNLGHGLGAVMARALGAPIGHICLASNANRVLTDYLNGAGYHAKASEATLANAMDVGAPSNFERLFHLFPDVTELSGETVSDAEISRLVSAAPKQYNHVICPHTACGFAAFERLSARQPGRDWLIAATAHAAKFESIVEPLIGRSVPVPSGLAQLLAKPAQAYPMAATDAALERILLGG
jgi:threonine synthase